MRLNNFPFFPCTRIRKYISSTSLSLTLQGELLAPSSTHLQKCVNISRTQLPPLDNNLSVSLGSQSHCAVSFWGKGSCLAKSVFSAQSSSYLVSWSLFLYLESSTDYACYSHWNTFFTWFQRHHILLLFTTLTGRSLSISSAASSISSQSLSASIPLSSVLGPLYLHSCPGQLYLVSRL